MWLRGRDGNVTAELGGASERRGEGGGRGGAWRRAAVRSGITGREGKREPDEGEGVEREQRARGETEGATGHIQTRRGRLGGKQEVARGGARVRKQRRLGFRIDLR